MGMPVEPVYSQLTFRGRTNVQNPTGINAAFDAGDAAAGDDWSQVVDTIFRVRFVILQSEPTAANNLNMATEFVLQYNYNGGGWVGVAAQGTDTDPVQYADGDFTDGDPTTQLVGTAQFVTGEGVEVTPSGTITFSEEPGVVEETELEFSVEIVSGQVTPGLTLELRVIYSAEDETPPATAFGTYTDTPVITVAGPAQTVPMAAESLVSKIPYITSVVVEEFVTRWRLSGTQSSEAKSGGSDVWTLPSGVSSPDDALAAATTLEQSEYSDWLRLTNFGFTTGDVPTGAAIEGIEILFAGFATSSDMSDDEIWLRDSSGQVGANGAENIIFPVNVEDVWTIPASAPWAADWSADLTDDDVRASTFGLDFSVINDNASTNVALLGAVWVRIYYSLGAPQTVPMVAATLASSPQALTVFSPVAQTVTMTAVPALVDLFAVVTKEDGATHRAHPESLLNDPGVNIDWVDNYGFVPNLKSGRAFSSADGYIKATLLDAERTDDLNCTSFGFTSDTVPAGTQIDGIQFLVFRNATAAFIKDLSIRLLHADTPVGDDQAITVIPWETIWEDWSYGADQDDWSAGTVPSDTWDSGFGIRIRVQADEDDAEAQIDSITCRIWYSIASQTVNMSAVTLASSAESLNVDAPITIQMAEASLVGILYNASPWFGVAVQEGQTPWHSPQAMTTGSTLGGDVHWDNLDEAIVQDEIGATVQLPSGFSDSTNYLIGTQAGFTTSQIPLGAFVRDVEIKWRRKASTGGIVSSGFNMFLSGGRLGDVPNDGVFLSDEWETGIGDNNIGGWEEVVQNLSSADVRDPTFGYGVRHYNSVAVANLIRADVMYIRVFWTFHQTITMQSVELVAETPVADVNFVAGDWTRRHAPELAVNVPGVEEDWIDPELAKFPSGGLTYAYVLTDTAEESDLLRFTDLRFTSAQIPTDSIIKGIEVEVSWREVGSNITNDITAQLYITSGPVGDNKATGSFPASSWGRIFYGGSTDDWNAGLVPTDIHSSDFGFSFAVDPLFGDNNDTQVDFLTIRVWYAPAQTIAMGAATLASSAESVRPIISQIIQMQEIEAGLYAQRVSPFFGVAGTTGQTPWHGTGDVESIINGGTSPWGWSDPLNDVKFIDQVAASSFIPASVYTYYMRCTEFGFTTSDIPSNTSVVGVEVVAAVKQDSFGAGIQIYQSFLRTSGGQTGNSKSGATDWPEDYWADSEVLGGPADDWSASLSDADIRSAGFGIDFRVENTNGSFSTWAYVDALYIRVFWAAAQTIQMGAATLASSPQTLVVSATAASQTIALSAITLASSPESLDVVAGTVTVDLSAVTLASSAQTLVVIAVAPQTISMVAATLASSAQTLDVIPGAVTVSLSAITLVSSPEAGWILAGNVTVSMSAATLASSPQGLLVFVDILISMSAATLASSPQTLTVLAAGAPLTVSMSAATLVSAAQTLNVAVDEIVGMGAATLVSSAQALIVVAGGVVVSITEVTLASSAQDLRVETAQIVSMSAITLVGSPQALAILAAGTPQTISMVVATLVSSAQALNVAADQIAVMSEATLVSSAQGLSVLAGAISATMSEATLVSSPQGLSVTAGNVNVFLSAATLVSSPQALTAIVSGAPQTISLSAITLISNPQGLNVATDQIVLMGSVILASAAQTLTVSIGAVSLTVTMGIATLVSSPQGLVVLSGVVTISMEAATLVSTTTSLIVIPGAVTIAASSITLVSSAEGLNIAAVVSVLMGTVTLVSDAQTLSLILGTAFVRMTPATLVSQALPFNAFTDQIIASMIFALFTQRTMSMDVRQRDIDFDLL